MSDGWDNLLIYNADIFEGILSCDDNEDYPYVGKNNYRLRENQYSTSVVNEDILRADWIADGEALFKNMVVHEVLHAADIDHPDGENYYEENSPMISAYTETFSNNDPPSTSCNDAEVLEDINDWRLRLSGCSQNKFENWMENEY